MRFYHIFKRFADIIIALVLILALIPFYVIIYIAVRVTSKGPVIYKHPRVGKGKKEFVIYKFRSMYVNARSMQQKGIWDENRLLTPIGKFIRTTFLDEIPQLVNILKGDLTFIGPRPLDVETFQILRKQDKRWNNTIRSRPGLTSLESVADYLPEKERKEFERHFKGLLKKDKETDQFKHRLVLDLYYVENESLLFDIKIFLKTMLLTLRKLFSKA